MKFCLQRSLSPAHGAKSCGVSTYYVIYRTGGDSRIYRTSLQYVYIYAQVSAYTDTLPKHTQKTKAPSLAHEDTLLVQQRAFKRQRRRLPKNQTNSHIVIYEMQIFSCSMIISLSPLPLVDNRNNGMEQRAKISVCYVLLR